MKKLFFLLLLISSYSFAQHNYIIDKKGTKVFVRDDQTEVILIDKRISYVLVGKTWEKYIKFDDLDYAVIGSSVLKSYNLDKSRKSKVYFIYGENQKYQLIGVTITVTSTSTSGGSSYSKAYYELLVVDMDQNIVEDIKMDGGSSKGDIETRSKVAPMIRKYFSDCPALMSKLQEYEDGSDEKKTSILGFMYHTDYINCNK